MLCQFLLNNKVSQLYVYTYPRPPWASIPPPQVITQYRAELPALSSRFPLALCFTQGSVFMSVLLSVHLTLSYQLSGSQICSPCLHLYSCPISRFISTIFLDFIYVCVCVYVLIYDICSSLSDLLQYDRLQVHPHHYK